MHVNVLSLLIIINDHIIRKSTSNINKHSSYSEGEHIVSINTNQWLLLREWNIMVLNINYKSQDTARKTPEQIISNQM